MNFISSQLSGTRNVLNMLYYNMIDIINEPIKIASHIARATNDSTIPVARTITNKPANAWAALRLPSSVSRAMLEPTALTDTPSFARTSLTKAQAIKDKQSTENDAVNISNTHGISYKNIRHPSKYREQYYY